MEENRNIQLVNKMISDAGSITNIEPSATQLSDLEEYYFRYPNDKYLWSIIGSNSGFTYVLYFYPKGEKNTEFLKIDFPEDADSQLERLFKIVKNNQFGFDKVVDDILG